MTAPSVLSSTYVVCTGYETTPGLCHWCGQPVAHKRRSYCSDGCRDQYLLNFWWPEASRACKERANYTCGWCGVHGNRVHHKDPLNGKRRDWNVKNRPENLVFLCNSCHGKAHAEKLEPEMAILGPRSTLVGSHPTASPQLPLWGFFTTDAADVLA